MSTPSHEDILKALTEDKAVRDQAIKMLARDFPKEYLQLVKIDSTKLNRITPDMIISDKEWQE
jgi:hypothetical protein